MMNELKIMIKNIKKDENFEKALEYNKSHSFFDIMSSVWERESSDFIAWLLDPKESHGLKNIIFKNLIKECKNAHGRIRTLKKRTSSKDFNSKVYDNFYFEVEVAKKLRGKNKKNRRLDVVLVNPIEKIIIILENKYGSPRDEKQLESYIKIFEDNYSEKYKIIPIFIDATIDEEKVKNQNKCWNYIGYSWIANTLEKSLEKLKANKESRVIINDIILEIRSEYENDKRFKKSVKAINKLSEYHKELSLRFYDLKKNKFKRLSEEPEILLFMKQNEVILDRMYDTHKYHALSKIIEKLFTKSDYIFDLDYSSKGVAFTTKKIDRMTKEGDTWAVDITFYYSKHKKKYEIYLYVDSSKIKNQSLLSKILQSDKQKILKNRKNYYLYKEETDVYNFEWIRKNIKRIEKKSSAVFNMMKR
ncbi:hypothetical protein A9Q84_14670 [Halobacteriovorax marinus]|uniref:PD-(D/E)XK nuclease superfamily protein n=1 Tax=Halobacteriovorax marinus TaxID=97084 RepID=A0A1Y5F515_9BACT|nr:hypothetical protein A9Q84_14670 [Halobacteriovorax marinus]